MKLRSSITSPYARKVRMVIYELGITSLVEEVPTNPWDEHTDLPGDNPLGKVPALTSDDGYVLFDSPVICEYLESQYGTGRLFPAAWDEYFYAMRLQAVADGATDALVARLLEGRRPQQYQWHEWSERQSRAAERALNWLEARIKPVRGDFSIGAISVVAMLGYLDFRFGHDADWRASRPRLAEWYEKVSQRRSVLATAPKE